MPVMHMQSASAPSTAIATTHSIGIASTVIGGGGGGGGGDGGGAAGGVSALAELEAEEGGSCTMRSGTIAVGGTSAASRPLSAALAANAPTAAAAAPARSPARAAAEQRVHGAQQDELYLASRARDRVRARREERARGEGLID